MIRKMGPVSDEIMHKIKSQSRDSTEAMAAPLSPPRLLPSGDSAITVEFSRNIDDAANRRVLALDRAMAARAG